MKWDKIILGAGLYGIYSAWLCGKKGQKVLVLEYDAAPFMRATYINQARVHMGYHYPRSYSTAVKSAHYFNRFYKDYSDCILTEFKQIYATSSDFSWTNAEQFKKFCDIAEIKCEEVSPKDFFKTKKCDGAFLTKEYTYDAQLLKSKLLNDLKKYTNVKILYNVRIKEISSDSNSYYISLTNGEIYESPFVLNATYASVNQINKKLGFEQFQIKYELCEIILCDVSERLKHIGITVMDGPFFSIMPFGKTGFHSLTAVTFTPHITSYTSTPVFDCQQKCEKGYCSPEQLGNCNYCQAKPETAWNYMSNLAHKYMRDDLKFQYKESLYSMKPILKTSELDDSRPTLIRTFTHQPRFVSVLSGKINTVYDLDEVLLDD